jgi:hypothetical protein
MTDYGRDLEFGVSIVPLADPPDWAARLAKAADRTGLDLVGNPGPPIPTALSGYLDANLDARAGNG